MPNHGSEPPAPVLLARHRRSGGTHVAYRRVTGVHRAEGLGRPARRYLLTVALLAGTSSLPILAAIGSGSATVSDGMRPADATPFVPPPAGASPLVAPLPTAPPVAEPGPAGSGDRSRQAGSRPLAVPPGAVAERPGFAVGEPGPPPVGRPAPTDGPEIPNVPTPPTTGTPTQSPVPSPPPATPPSPSPSPSPFPSPPSPSLSPFPSPSSEHPTGTPPSSGPSGSPTPTGVPPSGTATTPAPTPVPVPGTPPPATDS
ncbi:hypothetical protein ACN28C_06225 [Plantactinospora sp. WMMC1484]|uniref:hypothetical protein n=1 Tax=Plantactinospora sp. WMMC1484 TaxID=3404122 RepID=UPI003BF5CAEC